LLTAIYGEGFVKPAVQGIAKAIQDDGERMVAIAKRFKTTPSRIARQLKKIRDKIESLNPF
jgi:hypothetical protein